MTPYTLPDGTVVDLDRPFLDLNCGGWEVDDSQHFDPAAGPELHSTDRPLLHMPLLGMARYCGLWQAPVTERWEAHDLDPGEPFFLRSARLAPGNPAGSGGA